MGLLESGRALGDALLEYDIERAPAVFDLFAPGDVIVDAHHPVQSPMASRLTLP